MDSKSSQSAANPTLDLDPAVNDLPVSSRNWLSERRSSNAAEGAGQQQFHEDTSRFPYMPPVYQTPPAKRSVLGDDDDILSRIMSPTLGTPDPTRFSLNSLTGAKRNSRDSFTSSHGSAAPAYTEFSRTPKRQKKPLSPVNSVQRSNSGPIILSSPNLYAVPSRVPKPTFLRPDYNITSVQSKNPLSTHESVHSKPVSVGNKENLTRSYGGRSYSMDLGIENNDESIVKRSRAGYTSYNRGSKPDLTHESLANHSYVSSHGSFTHPPTPRKSARSFVSNFEVSTSSHKSNSFPGPATPAQGIRSSNSLLPSKKRKFGNLGPPQRVKCADQHPIASSGSHEERSRSPESLKPPIPRLSMQHPKSILRKTPRPSVCAPVIIAKSSDPVSSQPASEVTVAYSNYRPAPSVRSLASSVTRTAAGSTRTANIGGTLRSNLAAPSNISSRSRPAPNVVPNHMPSVGSSSRTSSRLDKHVNFAKEKRPKRTSSFTVNGKEFFRLCILGTGASSVVYMVVDSEQKLFALKRMRINPGAGKEVLKRYENEITLLQTLKGKETVIEIFESEIRKTETRIYVVLVLELGSVDLSQILKSRRNSLTRHEILKYWREMLLAVHDIQEERIVHSDLKPQNFLLVKDRLKLIDFGISKRISHMDTTHVQNDGIAGTWQYMSPESVQPCDEEHDTFKLSRKADVWSLGIILYQMVYGRTPFYKYRGFHMVSVLSKEKYKIAYNDIGAPELVRIIRRCLVRNHTERATIRELLEDSLICDVGQSPLRRNMVTIDAYVRGLDQQIQSLSSRLEFNNPELQKQLSDFQSASRSLFSSLNRTYNT
eukprot:147632_1